MGRAGRAAGSMEDPPEPEPAKPWRRRARRALDTWEAQEIWARYNQPECRWTTPRPPPPGVDLEYWLVAGLTRTHPVHLFVFVVTLGSAAEKPGLELKLPRRVLLHFLVLALLFAGSCAPSFLGLLCALVAGIACWFFLPCSLSLLLVFFLLASSVAQARERVQASQSSKALRRAVWEHIQKDCANNETTEPPPWARR